MPVLFAAFATKKSVVMGDGRNRLGLLNQYRLQCDTVMDGRSAGQQRDNASSREVRGVAKNAGTIEK